MLSPFLVSLPETLYLILPPPASMRVLPHLPTHSCLLALDSPTLEHGAFTGPRASPTIDGQLGHTLQHMQLETQVLGVGGTG